MAFNGKLVELKTGNNYVELPLKYMKAESYKVTPNQRMESSANRASTGVLIRSTVSHTASKIDFSTPPLTNSDVNALNTLLTNAYTNALQRKLDLRYYDPSSDSYKTGTFYVPDIDYDISRIEKSTNVIHYNSIRIAFIEY
jgi:hypothetical protein